MVYHTPQAIEAESMRIIGQELAQQGLILPEAHRGVIQRAIHTTADFEYATSLMFTPGAVEAGLKALRQEGCVICTDTNMARAGINLRACEAMGVSSVCYMAHPEVAAQARQRGTTRAVASVDRWVEEYPEGIFAVGNAPTALLRMVEWMERGRLRPALVIGVPVGFVNVTESKEQLWKLCQAQQIPAIVSMGRKGGSTVAAAICNALLYQSMEEGGD